MRLRLFDQTREGHDHVKVEPFSEMKDEIHPFRKNTTTETEAIEEEVVRTSCEARPANGQPRTTTLQRRNLPPDEVTSHHNNNDSMPSSCNGRTNAGADAPAAPAGQATAARTNDTAAR